MRNISRHQAGTKTAGVSTGGQFKAHERADAAAPPLPGEWYDYRFARTSNTALAKLGDLDRVMAEMVQHRNTLLEAAIAGKVRQEYPDASHIVIGMNTGPSEYEDQWGIAGAEHADGTQVELSPDFSDELDELFDQRVDGGYIRKTAEAGERYEEIFEAVDRLSIDEALEAVSGDTLRRSFIDTGNLEEPGYNSVIHAAQAQLNASTFGVTMTNDDFAEELNTHWQDGKSEDLTDEQVAILSKAAAEIFANNETPDSVYRESVIARNIAIRDASEQIGIMVSEV